MLYYDVCENRAELRVGKAETCLVFMWYTILYVKIRAELEVGGAEVGYECGIP